MFLGATSLISGVAHSLGVKVMRIVAVNETTVEALVACFRPAGEDGHTREALLPTSAFGGKADVNHCVGGCPLLAISGLADFPDRTRELSICGICRNEDATLAGLTERSFH